MTFNALTGPGYIDVPQQGRIPVSLQPARSSHVWILTFSDLVLLLLTFFILLFAMSDIDLERYGALSRSTGQALADPILDTSQTPTSVACPQSVVQLA